MSFCNLFQWQCTSRGRRTHMEFCFKNVIAYKLVCFLLFSTCLIHSSCSSAHGKASWDSFTSVFCHVEFLWCRFHVVRFVHRVDTYVGLVVCSSKPYVNKLILRSSRPSTSLYALTIKAITFLHTKCFIKTEFTRVHSQLVRSRKTNDDEHTDAQNYRSTTLSALFMKCC